MWFFGFWICPRRKVIWSNLLQVLGTRGSSSENFNVDDFTLSGNLCYSKDNGERLHHTHLQELFNLRWYIQHLIDERGYDDDDDDYLDNPLSEDNWMLQTNRKFMKYVIYNGHSMTLEQLNKNLIRPII